MISENYNNPYQDFTGDMPSYEEELLLNYDDYLQDNFSNSFEFTNPEEDSDFDTEDDEDDFDEDDIDDDLIEDYDENDREPDTFSDDGFKVD